jgi:hypothetical protein
VTFVTLNALLDRTGPARSDTPAVCQGGGVCSPVFSFRDILTTRTDELAVT